MQEVLEPVFSLIYMGLRALEGTYGPAVQTAGIILFVLIFNFLIKTFLLNLRERYANKGQIWKLSFVSALYKPLSYYVWLIAVLASIDILSSSLWTLHALNFPLLLRIGGVCTLSWFLLRWNSTIAKSMMERSQNQTIALTPDKLDLLSKMVTIVIILLAVFLLMDVTGQNVQTLIAFSGIGGIALAFASQQVISNFFGGLMVYLTQPFTIGEWINIPDRKIEGHVEEIGWYMTRIRSFDKRPFYVPNSVFSQTVVSTPSRMSHNRIQFTLSLRQEDIKVVKEIAGEIKKMLLDLSFIDRRQKTEAYLAKVGGTSLDIEVSAFIALTEKVDFNAAKQEILLKTASIVEKYEAKLAITNISVHL